MFPTVVAWHQHNKTFFFRSESAETEVREIFPGLALGQGFIDIGIDFKSFKILKFSFKGQIQLKTEKLGGSNSPIVKMLAPLRDVSAEFGMVRDPAFAFR